MRLALVIRKWFNERVYWEGAMDDDSLLTLDDHATLKGDSAKETFRLRIRVH